ncbi:MAG: hypothetical protein F6J93_16425 [Oscillatoria sp. SIO1A7]|nr:hypothetical protein [Oscillatoria sp. SIO1A7]
MGKEAIGYSGSQISVINDRDGKCRGDSIPKTVSAVERQPPSWDASPVATSHQEREMLYQLWAVS